MYIPKMHGFCMLFALSLTSFACDDSASMERSNVRGGGSTAPAAAVAAEAALAQAEARNILKDSDFVESEGNRDPFRSYEEIFRPPGAPRAQRPVLLPNTEIDNLRLIAIVTGIEQPRAMLVDEQGVGYVTSRGDYVGRADVVRTGGAENLAVTVNWRIDRIRDNEVVLARDDPSGPNRPPLTRIIPLRGEDEDEDGSG
jgi:type IV pilus assembly protein PilP